MLFSSPPSCTSLRVASGEMQTQRPPAPEGHGAPGCGRAPGDWRGGAHTPFLQTHRFSGPASSGPSSAPPPCGPRPRGPQPRALRRRAPGTRSEPPGRAARGGGGGGASGPRRAASGSRGRRAGRRGARPGAELRPRARPPLALRRPAGAAMEVYIPSFRYEESDLERGYTANDGEEESGGRRSRRLRRHQIAGVQLGSLSNHSEHLQIQQEIQEKKSSGSRNRKSITFGKETTEPENSLGDLGHTKCHSWNNITS
ncbi:sorting nexin-24 isoform X2 [Mustela erminea]|uniref:sorting nexin-24 isoform X2 n=1 Tax=Mustela erminea TaxID=36723 RepID=UPI0013872AB4|nr:sorting nexin-24 isoform X2 [Mustela erminea]